MRTAASLMMPCALRCRCNELGHKNGTALAGGLTALTGLQTLNLRLVLWAGGVGCCFALRGGMDARWL